MRLTSPRKTLRSTGLVAVVVLAGCTDLPPILAGECGNGVVEQGEDCDRVVDPALGTGTRCGEVADPAGQRCHYVCALDTGTPSCPGGWGCGPDGVCRFATGAYLESPASPVRMSAEGLHAGDVDGDGAPDLVGLTASFLEVRFNSGAGDFPGEIEITMDNPSAPPALGDLDEDGRLDVVVPLYAGLFVLLGQQDRTLAPVAYAPLEIVQQPVGGMLLLPLRIDPLYPTDSLLLVAAHAAALELYFLDGARGGIGPDPSVVLSIPGRTVDQIAGRVPIANIDVSGAAEDEIALPFAGDRNLVIYQQAMSDMWLPKMIERTVVRLPGRIDQGAMFTDYDGDGDLDLLVSILDDTDTSVVAVSLGDGAGRFDDGDLFDADDAFVDTRFEALRSWSTIDSPDPSPSYGTPWPLAAGDLGGDGAADYVGADGVFIMSADYLTQTAYRTGAYPWSQAAAADYNRDGRLDLAVSSGEEEGVEFLMNAGSSLFNRTRVDTNAPAAMLRAGDFDGDFVADVAVAEKAYYEGRDGMDLSILFGALQGAPASPVSMGTLQYIQSLEPADLPISTPDLTNDLVVLSREQPQEGTWTVAFMMGTSMRRMLSPFTLYTEDDMIDVPVGVEIGRFSPDDTIPDVVALAPPHAWLVVGAGEARFDPQDAIMASPAQLGDGTLDAYCSVWTAGDVNGDGARDELVGVDAGEICYGWGGDVAPKLVTIGVTGGTELVSIDVQPFVGSMRAAREVRLADVDADGALDLVVVFAGEVGVMIGGGDVGGGPTMPYATGSAVVVVWNDGAGLDAASAVSATLPVDGPLHDVVAINADADPQLELAIMAGMGVHIAQLEGGRTFAAPQLVVPLYGAAGRMVAADLDQDGLDDLAISTSGGEVRLFTAVPSGAAIKEATK